MRRLLLLAALLFAPLFSIAVPGTASALTLVATIGGCYDCFGNFDTPVLYIDNTTGGTLTNAQMVLLGYNGDNGPTGPFGAQTTTVNLGTLGAGTTYLVWGNLPGGSNAPFSLTANDYDDEFTGTAYVISSTNCGGTCVSGGGPQYYADTGDFGVTFTATVSGGTYDGQSVFSVFSPANNATGGFVGWEGVDPNGYSEQSYDIHSGTVTDDLANIYLGTPPPPGVPEPAEWALMLIGFGGVGAVMRSRRSRVAAAIA